MHLSLDEITVVDIELTNKCNAACPACNRAEIPANLLDNTEYTLDDIKRIIPQQFLKPGVDFIFGGTVDESTMNTHLVDICEYILSSGACIELDTNTGACPAEVFTKLGNLSNKYNHRLSVRFSVDGLEHTNHLYRVNVKWKTVLRNMKAYAATGGKCLWQYLVFDHNYQDIEEAYKLSKTLGIPFELRQGTRGISEYLSLITEKDHQTKKIKKKEVVVNHSTKFEHEYMEERKNLLNSKVLEPNKITCLMLHKKQIFLDASGKLWPCCWFASGYGVKEKYYSMLESKYGTDWNDIHVFSIEQILQHPYYKEILYKSFEDDAYSEMFNNTCQIECGDGGYRHIVKRQRVEDK